MAPAIIGANAPCLEDAALADTPYGRWLGLCAADALTTTELIASAPRDVADYVLSRLAFMDAGLGTVEDARLMFAYLVGGAQ